VFNPVPKGKQMLTNGINQRESIKERGGSQNRIAEFDGVLYKLRNNGVFASKIAIDYREKS